MHTIDATDDDEPDVAPAEPTEQVRDPQLLQPDRVAALLGISRDHVFTLMRRGDLAYIKVGRFYRISKDDLLAFIRASRVIEHHLEPLTVRVRARVRA